MSERGDNGGEQSGYGKTANQISETYSYDLEVDEPVVVVVSGPETGRRVEIDEDEPTVVGRSRGADVQIEDSGVSSRHLRWVERSSSIWVEDLDSSNGTYVNRNRIQAPRELLEGDTIGIGRETLLCLTFAAGTEGSDSLRCRWDGTDRGGG